MNKFILSILSIIFFFSSYSQKEYKTMMDDMSINFYDVCKEADKYFETHDKNKKGSGWKGYQRWRNANEIKYYPSGRRNNIDHSISKKAYKTFLETSSNFNTKSLFNNGWEELGPFFIDSIAGGYAPGLGRIEDLYVDPNNADLIYAGSRSGGLWKTSNGGVNWTPKTDFLLATGVNTIGVSPTNSDSLLINIQNSNNNYSHGIYRSIDGGNNWTSSNFNPTNTPFGGFGDNFKINVIKYHPSVSNLIFIGTNKGVFRSEDNLATWTRLYYSGNIIQIEFHTTDNNIIYIYDKNSTNRNYVLRSTDQGLSYVKSTLIPGNNNDPNGRLSVSNACNDCLYFASSNGVWKSLDKGINFTFMSNPTEICRGFAVNDIDTNQMIYGYVDLEASSNGGANFNRVTRWSLGNTNGAGSGHHNSFLNSTDYVHPDLRIAKCINGVFYIGTDGFVSKSSDNGISWTVIGQGIATKEFYKLGVSQSNHNRTVAGSQDNGTSIKHKDYWLEFYGADGMECFIHPLNDDYIVGSVQFGSRRRTKDGGHTQSGINAPGQNGSGNSYWEAPIAYDPNNHMTIYNFSEKVYKSDDFGNNWTFMGDPPFNGTIRRAAIAENDSKIIVVSYFSNIYKSIDEGVSYINIKNNLPTLSIEDIAFDPKNDDNIIVVNASYQSNNNKIYLTTNGGNSWTNITFNLGEMPIQSVVIDHTDDSNIYIGTEIGVYTKTMNGTNWSLYNTDLPNCTIEELEIVYGSNTLRAATWGRGVWEYTLVGRKDFPAIVRTKITDQPTDYAPLENFDQFVTSKISYDNTLSSVFVKWSINSPTFGNTIAMSNTTDSTWVSVNALPNYPTGTKMYFKVFAVGNNNDTTETYKFMYTVKPFEYCDASGNMNWEGNVTLVDFEEINNPTGKTQAYTNYSSTDSATVILTQTYPITVNLKTDNGNFKYYAKVWIDWNRNTQFESSESYELGFSQNVADGATNLSPFNIIVPENAKVGETRMRVACKYNSYPSSCDNGIDGEIEDYKIIVKEKPDMSFNISETVLCNTGEYINFNYLGETMDSIKWEFTNGTNIYTSENFTDQIMINQFGSYNLLMTTYINEFIFTKQINNVFKVQFLNFTTNVSGHSILVEPSGLEYQWLDCGNEYNYITGATSQIFNATENGNYAVQIFDGNCTDTSSCVSITNIGIQDDLQNNFTIYPNPTSSIITIEITEFVHGLRYDLTNSIGQKILTGKTGQNLKFDIDLKGLSVGVYTLHLFTSEKNTQYKIIKK